MRTSLLGAATMLAMAAIVAIGPVVTADKGKESSPQADVHPVVEYWVILEFPAGLEVGSARLTPLWHGTKTKSFPATHIAGGAWVVQVQSVAGVQARTCRVDLEIVADGGPARYAKKVTLPDSNHCDFTKEQLLVGKDGWADMGSESPYEWVWFSPVLPDIEIGEVISIKVSANWLLKIGESWAPLTRTEGGTWLGVEVCPASTAEKEMKAEVSLELKDGTFIKVNNAAIRVLKRLVKP